MLLSLKARLLAFGAAILTVIGFIFRFRYVKGQRDRFRQEASDAKAALEYQQAVIESDAEIEAEYSDLKREADRDIADDKMPANIRNPNDF